MLGVVACGSVQRAPVPADRTFQTGITGSAPLGRTHPNSALADPAVRRLVVELADAPIAVPALRARLAEQAYTLEELISIGLVAIDGDRVRLAFAYLSADDQRQIAARARPAGRQLADRLIARRAEIETAAAPPTLAALDRQRLLFFLVGCMALDWDGLAVTADRSRAGDRPQ